MRNAKWIFICLLLIGKITFGQHGKAGASASPSTSSSGSAATTAGSSQTGFVYYLKYKKHIEYSSTKTEVLYFTKSQLKNVTYVLGEKVKDGKTISATLIFDRRTHAAMHNGMSAFIDYDLRPFKVVVGDVSHPKDTCANCRVNDDTLLTVTFVYNDSIPRYWEVPRPSFFSKPLLKVWKKSVFAKTRLRVSMTQDSAIIHAKPYYPNTNVVESLNTYDITNPTLKYGIPGAPVPKDNPGHQGNYSGARSIPWPVKLFEACNPEKLHFGSHATPDSLGFGHSFRDDSALYVSQLTQYNQALQIYLSGQYLAASSEYTNPNQNQLIFCQYKTLVKGYEFLQTVFEKLTKSLKDSLSTKRIDMYNPLSTDSVRLTNQLNFVSDLYAFSQSPLQPPSAPPGSLTDSTKSETAISLSTADSSKNFYFNILQKNSLGQSMYFASFHYGVWDYGTLTVPFRYRFAEPKKIVITQAGKAGSAAPAPSEADATLNVGTYLGRKWGHTRYYEDASMTANTFSFEVVGMTGPSLIALSTSNIDSTSKYTGDATGYGYTGPSNIIAWTAGAGAVVQWKSISFGFYLGKDFPLVAKTGWVYAHKTWLGFGIGVNLGMLSSGNSVN